MAVAGFSDFGPCYLCTDQAYVDRGGYEQTFTYVAPCEKLVKQGIAKVLGVEPGHKVKVILYDNRIEMIPVKPVTEARGFLRGIDTSVDRDADRL